MSCIYCLRGEAHFLFFPQTQIQAFLKQIHVHYHITARPGGATVARLTPVQKVACSNHVRVRLSFLIICNPFSFDYRTLNPKFALLYAEYRHKSFFFMFVHNVQFFKFFRKRDVLIKDENITSTQPNKRDIHVHETCIKFK